MIISVHTFEHIVNFIKTLKSLKNKLNDNGKIFIQIPYLYNNPFDLIIYDHVYHFSKKSIFEVSNKCDLNIEIINSKKIYGELSIIFTKKRKNTKLLINYLDKKNLNQFKYLELFISKIKNLKKFSLLGSGIQSMWLYSYFKDRIVNIYDEDISRINKKFHSKKIKSINKNLKEKIVIPFYKKKLQKIKKRLLNNNYSLNLFP